MKQLVAIPPKDLNLVWPEIRGDVQAIESPEKILVEDVYFACKSGDSQLFLLMIDGKRVGHMIMKLIGTDLHIWQVAAENGYDVLHTFRAEVMALARNTNMARKLTYSSAREGWRKESKKHGFSMRMVVYECPIDPPIPVGEETPIGEGSREDGSSHEVGN
jgi:hypothetical protein